MNFSELKQQYDQYISCSYGRYDLAIASGKGALCKDTAGKEYVDFSSGIGVNCLGYSDEGWAKAVSEQAMTLQHACNLYYTLPGGRLAETLSKRTGLKKTFFANSGAEANEGAIKAARKYSFDKYGGGRNEIITLCNSFHGRTITTLAATGQEVFHNYFFPFTEGFAFASANDINDVKAKLSDKTCAIMIELVQGEGGVLPLDSDFVAAVAKLCTQQDILLIIDEVQTGIGRTGKLFCFEHYGIIPDIATAAKGLGGGLPIAAVMLGGKVCDTFKPGDHGTTFGANPVCCAAANYVLSVIDDAFLAEVAKKGEYIKNKLLDMPRVKSVSGKGMMIGIELDGADAKTVVSSCIENGLIALTAKTKVRLLPPLNISYAELDKGLAILENVLKNI